MNGLQKDSKEGTPEKYSYEQLNDICGRLVQENQYLKQELQQASKYIRTIDRLDYLFKVVDIQNKVKTGVVFHDEFYYKCVQEIEDIMTVPEEAEKETPKEN